MDFCFPTFRKTIQARLKELGLSHKPFMGTEFICSNKKQLGPFMGRRRTKYIQKLKREQGISVTEVGLSTPAAGQEKGVDTTVITKMFEASENLGRKCEIVLVASDRDYIPPTQVLRRWGCHVINVAFDDANHSDDQINESFMFLNLTEILKRMDEARAAMEAAGEKCPKEEKVSKTEAKPKARTSQGAKKGTNKKGKD